MSENQLAGLRGENVSIIFQFFQMLPALSLLQNVILPMDFANKYSTKERKEKAMELGGVPSLMAFVDKDTCNGCGFCEEVCFYFAMKVEDKIAQAEKSKCTGCGLCLGTCPFNSISLVEREGI